jgi:hypothetical protein
MLGDTMFGAGIFGPIVLGDTIFGIFGPIEPGDTIFGIFGPIELGDTIFGILLLRIIFVLTPFLHFLSVLQ